MKYCRGLQCPNKKQCTRWVEDSSSIEDKNIINKCLNNREFIKKNG